VRIVEEAFCIVLQIHINPLGGGAGIRNSIQDEDLNSGILKHHELLSYH
jgi:hypothetical protein